MNTAQRISILFLSLVTVTSVGCESQNLPPSSNLPPYEQQQLAKAARQVRIREPWDGSDQPFLAIQRSVDNAVVAGQNIKTLAAKNKAIALRNPVDAPAQFRWAYTALKAAPTITETADPWQGLHNLPEAMWAVPSPRSYSYDRLLFLVESFQTPARELRPLGERLLKRNSNDLPVIYEFIPLLQIGKVPAEKQRALRYTQQLLKAQPRNPRFLSTKGYVYYRSMLGNQSLSDGKNTIAAYQKYLEIAPTNDSGRASALDSIKLVKKYRHLLKNS